MKEIISFIKYVKHNFSKIITPDVSFTFNFVLGNCSCDMDSFTSSIIYSYYRNIQLKSISVNEDDKNGIYFHIYDNNNILYIPILNCNKGELFNRLDISELCSKYNLSEDDFLYFNEEFKIEDNNKNEKQQLLIFNKLEFDEDYYSLYDIKEKPIYKYEFTLVDHHELSITQRYLSKYVVEIIDHHDDKNFDYNEIYPDIKSYNNEYPRASTTSIILESIIKNKEVYSYFKQSLSDKENSNYDLFLAAIALDSVNFDNDIKDYKWVDLDYRISNLILKYCSNSVFITIADNANINTNQFNNDLTNSNNFYVNKLYTCLNKAKYDVEKNLNLGLKSLINKDRKDFETKITYNGKTTLYKGIFSSIPISLEKIIDKYSKNTVNEFFNSLCLKENANLIVVIYKCNLNTSFHYIYNGKEEFNNECNPFLNKEIINNYYNYLKNDIKTNQVKKFNLIKLNSELLDNEDDINTNLNFVINSEGGGINRKFLMPNLKRFLEDLNCC